MPLDSITYYTDLQEPANYKPVTIYPRYTVRKLDHINTPVGRTFSFVSEDTARTYIKEQGEGGFSGTVSLRGEPSNNTSDPIERIKLG